MASLGNGKKALRRMFAAMNRRRGKASAAPESPALPPAAASPSDPPALPAWSKGRFAKTPEERKPERKMGAAVERSAEALRRRPLLWLGAAALLLLLLTLDLSTLARRLGIDEWLSVSLDETVRAQGGERMWASREDALILVKVPKSQLDPATRSAVGDSGLLRVPLGSWELPPRMRSLAGILLPSELQGARRRGAVEGVESSSAWLSASPAKDLERTRIAPDGSQGTSPYGPAYAGESEPAGKANRIRLTKGLFTGAVAAIMDVPAADGFRGADFAEHRAVPKGTKPEDMAAEMMGDDDVLKSLQQYGKSTSWKKLEKTNQAVPPNTFDGRRMLTSDSVMQLLQTKQNADSSLSCALCSVEDRVTDNRATYFGEKF